MYTEPPVMQECRGKQAGVGRRRTGACWPAGSEGRGLDDKASGCQKYTRAHNFSVGVSAHTNSWPAGSPPHRRHPEKGARPLPRPERRGHTPPPARWPPCCAPRTHAPLPPPAPGPGSQLRPHGECPRPRPAPGPRPSLPFSPAPGARPSSSLGLVTWVMMAGPSMGARRGGRPPARLL